jgi:hypothetical protein
MTIITIITMTLASIAMPQRAGSNEPCRDKLRIILKQVL